MRWYKLLIVVLLASCYRTPRLQMEISHPSSIQSILNELMQANNSIRTLKAVGNGTFNGNLYRGNFEFETYFEKSGKLATLIRGPFGVELARLWFKNDSLLLYFPKEKTLYLFNNTPEFTKLYPLPEITKLIPSIFGLVPIAYDSFSSYQLDSEKSGRVIVKNEKSVETLSFEHKNVWLITSYQFFSADTQLIADFSFENFQNYGKHILPSIVTITDFKGGDWVQLNYRKIKVNEKIDDDIWVAQVPKDVKIREIYR